MTTVKSFFGPMRNLSLHMCEISLWQVSFETFDSNGVFMRVPTMELLRLVGSFKLYVAFAKEPYKKDRILQKRHMILRSLLIVATLYYIIVSIHTQATHLDITPCHGVVSYINYRSLLHMSCAKETYNS